MLCKLRSVLLLTASLYVSLAVDAPATPAPSTHQLPVSDSHVWAALKGLYEKHLANQQNTDTYARAFDSDVLSLRPATTCKESWPGVPQYYCPSHTWANPFDWPCIRHTDLCNGIADCPKAEDEHPALCMFHMAEAEELKSVKKLIADHFIREHPDEVPNLPQERLP